MGRNQATYLNYNNTGVQECTTSSLFQFKKYNAVLAVLNKGLKQVSCQQHC